MVIYVLLAVTIFCIIIQAFFAASEMALISLDYITMKRNAEKGDPKAKTAVFFLENPSLLFGTTLLGVNLAIILNSATASFLTGIILEQNSIEISPQMQGIITTLFLMPVILFFGEIIPMGFSRLNPEWFVSYGTKYFKGFYLLLNPLVRITSFIAWIIGRILRTGRHFHASLITRKELESYITNSFAAADSSDQSISIERIIAETFEFSKTTAAQIMVPLNDIRTLPVTASIEDIRKIAGSYGYSRIPIYDGRQENIIGYVYVMDLIGIPQDMSVEDMIHKPFMVPESILLTRLLPQLAAQGEHIAFLVNKSGMIIGMVSREDGIEEIFGNIYDEYDLVAGQDHEILSEPIDANISIQDLNTQYNLSIPESDKYKTLAGFILGRSNRIPVQGTKIEIEEMTFIISGSTDRKITTVKIIKKSEND